MKNLIAPRLAESIAKQDMKSSGLIILPEKKIIAELPEEFKPFLPILAKSTPDNRCFNPIWRTKIYI